MKKILLIIASFISFSVNASLLVEIHGFASDSSTWDRSGINALLMQNGWQPLSNGKSANAFVAINLPASAPLGIQANLVSQSLSQLRQQFPDENLILAGHSSGGVLARMMVLNGNPFRISTLITIASPHLGTGRAYEGLDYVDSKPFFCPGPGFRILKDFLGGDEYDFLERSRGFMVDVLPANPGSLLANVNLQAHPSINYHSIVHDYGDEMVPLPSQDMNMIPSINGKSKLWKVHSRHALNIQDGVTLLQILSTMK